MPEFLVPVDPVGGPSAGSEDRHRGENTVKMFGLVTAAEGLNTDRLWRAESLWRKMSNFATVRMRGQGWGADDVWVRPPRQAASQPGVRDRWGGGGRAQWPQFEQSPIQIGGGGGTGEENLAGGKVEADRNRFSSKQPIEIE